MQNAQTTYTLASLGADASGAAAAVSNSIPSPGCTANGNAVTLVITGSPPTVAWSCTPTNALTVTMAVNAPRYWYSIVEIATQQMTWPASSLLYTNGTTGGTNVFAIGPYTGTPAPFGLIQAENFDLGGFGRLPTAGV